MSGGGELEVAIPSLLRAARACYGDRIRVELAAAGFDDVPRNGAYVLGAIGTHGAPLALAVSGLGVSKQAASQLIDTLVVRGYLARTPDQTDRRRMNVALTTRGQAAAAAIHSGVRSVENELHAQVSDEGVQALRAGLTALAQIGAERRDVPAIS